MNRAAEAADRERREAPSSAVAIRYATSFDKQSSAPRWCSRDFNQVLAKLAAGEVTLAASVRCDRQSRPRDMCA